MIIPAQFIAKGIYMIEVATKQRPAPASCSYINSPEPCIGAQKLIFNKCKSLMAILLLYIVKQIKNKTNVSKFETFSHISVRCRGSTCSKKIHGHDSQREKEKISYNLKLKPII